MEKVINIAINEIFKNDFFKIAIILGIIYIIYLIIKKIKNRKRSIFFF